MFFFYTGEVLWCSRKGDALNLDIDTLGKLLDGDAAPGRLVGEPLGVLLVHALQVAKSAYHAGPMRSERGTHSKVGHVGQEGVDLDHLLDGRASLLKDGLEVANAGSRLLLDGALNQIALGIAGDLARAVDGGGGLDGLGLRNGQTRVQTGALYENRSRPKTYVGAGSCSNVSTSLSTSYIRAESGTYAGLRSW